MRYVGAALLVLSLTLAACGDLTPPDQRLTEAPERTAAAATARMALESTTNIGDPDGSRMTYTVTGDGQVDSPPSSCS